MSKNLYKPIVIFLLSNTLVFGNLINGFYFSNKSNASNLNGKNIYINTDEKLSTNTNVVGSNVIADENLYINTNNLNVKASQDNYTSKNDSESINGSIAFTMYGGGGGTAGLGYGKSNSSSDSFLNNNSQLSGNNVNINVKNDAVFQGANVRANDTLNLNVGNNLVLESLRDEYSSNSKGFNVNAGIGFGSGGKEGHRTPSLDVGKQSSTNAGFSVNNGVTQNKQTVLSSITGDKVNVNVGNNTHLKGSVIASGDYDKNGNFVDNKNLNLTTKTLTSENIYDKDKNKSFNLSVGVDNSKKEAQGKMELGLNSSNKEQINYATIGEGTITTNSDIKDVNRDVNKSQVITKDESKNIDIYLSNTSINKALDPNQTIAKWTQDAKDLGLNVRNEIIQNLPSSMKLDKDGNGNIFDKTIGKALDATTDYGLGIIPTVGNAGGYVTQIATQFFGDNRGIIKTANKQDLLNMGINPEDIYPTEDGKYVTDPNKTVVILKDEEAIKKEQKLSDFNDSKIYLTQEQASKITHMFTNGIMNDTKDSFENSKEQTGNTSVIFINYNQTHGLLGDLMESGQDKIFVNTLGQSYLLTGSARQTSDYLVNLAQATNGNLIVDAHSQGSLLTYAAMLNAKSDLQNILKDKKDTTLKVGFYGSPVNSDDSSSLVRQLYLNSSVYTNTDIKVSDYFRSSVNPGDPVGSISIFLGGNGAGINSSSKSEGESFYVWFERGAKTMFKGKNPEDLKNSSPHSGYVCVIGCGDSMVTPDTKYYINLDGKEIKLENFYIERNLNKDFAKYPQKGK
ncbi:hypothetical protein Abu_0943 [Aliarcobacter butzleri RM4018]|uniref:Filamentous hemagglutinin n=1 Tax=Aliarcobacter butzleri (strain RM4018) TaxID=367737 RepID=A8ETC9_ALIB4|nr:hemagglutinin repeat-containing protein [Aliarcobacter butzleri]ABV67203.1 hypothetical protein Abu_0943 [Aliarcobacter butzleri RM4018]SNV27254.1 Uncharacterised protein [Aliarcobacter butzleri]